MAGINNTQVLLNSFLKTAQNILTHFGKFVKSIRLCTKDKTNLFLMQRFCSDNDKDKRTKLLNDLDKIVCNNCTHDEKTKKVTGTVREIIGQGDVETNEAMKLFKVRESSSRFLFAKK